MSKKYSLIIALLLIVLQACQSSERDECVPKSITKLSSERPNLNISLLLDLSDRINPEKYPDATMDYYKRDAGYISAVANAFEMHLWNKRSLKIEDKIQLYIEPEPNDKELNKKLNYLRLDFTPENATNCKISSISEKYDSVPKLIYESAITDDLYIGSDIWKFFKSKVNDLCIEEDHRNILVILTDGYVYHKNDLRKENNLTSYLTPQIIRKFNLDNPKWKERMQDQNYGFIPANENLDNLEVLVLGINANPKNPYEEDLIYKYWTDWFGKMGVENYEIKNALIPSNMNNIIKNFILQEV